MVRQPDTARTNVAIMVFMTLDLQGYVVLSHRVQLVKRLQAGLPTFNKEFLLLLTLHLLFYMLDVPLLEWKHIGVVRDSRIGQSY